MSSSTEQKRQRQQQAPQPHKWALGLSGGGLRSCASSAIFALAAMHTTLNNNKIDQEEKERNSTATLLNNNNDEEIIINLWDKFARIISVSGGSWFLSAYQCGAFRNLSEDYSIDDLLDVLQVSVVHSGDSKERQEKISAYLHQRTGVKIVPEQVVDNKNNKEIENITTTIHELEQRDNKLSVNTNACFVDNKTGLPIVDQNNNNDDDDQQQQPQQNVRDKISSAWNFQTTRARDAVRSGFVNKVLKPVASALNSKFGTGMVLAITSETPLADYQQYLEQKLLIASDATFGSIPTRRVCIDEGDNRQTEEDPQQQQQQEANSNRQRRRERREAANAKPKELWMACIGTEVFETTTTSTTSTTTQQQQNKNKQVTNNLVSNNNNNCGNVHHSSGSGFKQPEWSASKVRATSSTSWFAFGLTSPSTVFQISVHEEETKGAIPYQKNEKSSSSSSSSPRKTQISHFDTKISYRVRQEELVPLEPLPVRRMCAFCGSAFSASASNIADHAVTNGLGSLISWGSEKLFGKERGEQMHSSPLLGNKTMDVCSFLKMAPRNEHHHLLLQGGDGAEEDLSPRDKTGKEVSIALRDAGLEVNIPFLFMETNIFNVAFVLDSGSDAEVGRQLLWAQKRGHLGQYSAVFSSAEAKKTTGSRKADEKSMKKKKSQDDDNQDKKENNNNSTTKTTKVNAKIEQTWQIYLKDNSNELGPNAIVYILGVCEPELMEVEDVEKRVRHLRERYHEMREEFAVIVEWLSERGF